MLTGSIRRPWGIEPLGSNPLRCIQDACIRRQRRICPAWCGRIPYSQSGQRSPLPADPSISHPTIVNANVWKKSPDDGGGYYVLGTPLTMTPHKGHQTPLSMSSAPYQAHHLTSYTSQRGPLHLFPSSHWRRVIHQAGGHTTLDPGYTALPYMGTLRGSLQPPPPTTTVLKTRFTTAISHLTLKHLHTRSEYRAIPLSPEREKKAEQIKAPRHIIAHPTPGY